MHLNGMPLNGNSLETGREYGKRKWVAF